MGVQVNFYMTKADEGCFVRFARSDRDVAILPYAIEQSGILPLKQLPGRGEPFWFALWLWDRTNSPVPRLRAVPEQGHHVIDRFTSEVISWSRSYMDEGRLVRGRLWAETGVWWDERSGTTVTKGRHFAAWFARLSNWVKRRSVRNAVGDYLLPGAAAFAQEGGQLVQAVYSDGAAPLG